MLKITIPIIIVLFGLWVWTSYQLDVVSTEYGYCMDLLDFFMQGSNEIKEKVGEIRSQITV